MTTETNKPKPRRRWWQFSLRTLLIVLTGFGVALGWIVYRANEQRKTVEWVREIGGSVWYDYELDADGAFIDDAKPPAPEWLLQLLGKEYFQEVSAVDFFGRQPSEEQVEELRRVWPNCKIMWWPDDQDESP